MWSDYLLFAVVGLLPSFIWLLFYLHKDSHPEPKKLVLKVFFWGALTGPAALILQLGARWLCAPTEDFNFFLATLGQNDFRFILNILLFAPLTEEFLKFFVVRQTVLKNPAFDEPIDAMVYLVVSALGFAATENLLNIFTASSLSLHTALSIAVARFLSATFLHTLASATLGYFLALSLLNFKKRYWIFALGFFLAFALHSFYNFLTWYFYYQGNLGNFVIAAFIFLVLLGGLVSWQFQRLKKYASVCRFGLKYPQKEA